MQKNKKEQKNMSEPKKTSDKAQMQTNEDKKSFKETSELDINKTELEISEQDTDSLELKESPTDNDIKQEDSFTDKDFPKLPQRKWFFSLLFKAILWILSFIIIKPIKLILIWIFDFLHIDKIVFMKIVILMIIFFWIIILNISINSVSVLCKNDKSLFFFNQSKELSVFNYGKETQSCRPEFNIISKYSDNKKTTITHYIPSIIYFPFPAIWYLKNTETLSTENKEWWIYKLKPKPDNYKEDKIMLISDISRWDQDKKRVIDPISLLINLLLVFFILHFIVIYGIYHKKDDSKE